MTYIFRIIDDNGKIAHISAERRTQAIEKYCSRQGCTKEYVKKHCVVKKASLEGRIKERK